MNTLEIAVFLSNASLLGYLTVVAWFIGIVTILGWILYEPALRGYQGR